MDWDSIADRYNLVSDHKTCFVQRIGQLKSETEVSSAINLGIASVKNKMREIFDIFEKNHPEIFESRLQTRGKTQLLRDFLLRKHGHQENAPDDIDNLVQETRQQIRDKIQDLCSKIRVLDMSNPIELARIYTKVKVLGTIRSRQNREFQQIRDSHRIALSELIDSSSSQFSGQKIPGLNAVHTHEKLIILGRPGAGKTTFLRYLAMQSIEDGCVDLQCRERMADENPCLEEQCERKQELKQFVPFFIAVMDFADESRKNQLDLFSYIASEFDVSPDKLQLLLKEGKVLILLDGLDELGKDIKCEVLTKLESFSRKYYKNRFVIACRLAALDYNFQNFTEVEIANFDIQQIEDFVKSWFEAQNQSNAAIKFLRKLHSNENEPIQDLANNPLLLTLLCLASQDFGFPQSRLELYTQGLEVLLSKWDAKRNIERSKIYKGLWLDRKQDLLSQIAHPYFCEGEQIFAQREVVWRISEYIQNLQEIDPEENLEKSSVAVLDSIEAQHGLLVKQATYSYSFSHLTFQEYFTARYIASNCHRDEVLSELVKHLTEPRWREVFLLAVEMLQNSDCLVKLMKEHVDNLLAKDKTLQEFLEWAVQKSKSLAYIAESSYNLAAIRANYLDFDIALDPDRSLGYRLDEDLTLRFTCASFLARARGCTVEETFNEVDEILGRVHRYELEPAMAIIFVRTEIICELLQKLGCDSLLGKDLKQLYDEIPSELKASELTQEEIYEEAFSEWCHNHGKEWGDRLRELIVPYYSLGEQWRFYEFSEKQKDLLRKYYEANLLLVICLRSRFCYVTRNVRQEIEETLFLPIAHTVILSN